MSFTKTFIAPNGATLSYHKVGNIDTRGDVVSYTVQSWTSQADYLAGASPLWNTHEVGPTPAGFVAAIEALAVLNPDFAGAEAVADLADSVDAAKERATRKLRMERNALAVSGFTVGAFSLASDAASQTKILLGATQAMLNPATFSEPWLMADGTVQILNANQMRAVAKSLYDTIKALDLRLRDAQLAIAAATTIPAVEAVFL